MYREEIGFICEYELVKERWEVWSVLNGDAFFSVAVSPKDMRAAFYKKPKSDLQTFKLLLLCLGNGCSPYLIQRWIMLTLAWKGNNSTAEKRARQVDFVLNNIERRLAPGSTSTCCMARCFILTCFRRTEATDVVDTAAGSETKEQKIQDKSKKL